MSLCWIKAGWCGHETSIDTGKRNMATMVFTIESTCPHVRRMHSRFKEINIGEELTRKIAETKTFKVASKYIPCIGCPVPSAILKCVEAVSGSYQEADSMIKFLHFYLD